MTFTSRMVSVFEHEARGLEESSGGPVHLVRMKGPRASFVAGHVPKAMPFVHPRRVMLDSEWALFFYPPAGKEIDAGAVKALFREVLQ